MTRSLAAEFLGTAFLLATVVGSGIMGERLSGGNVALALLANSLATGAVLAMPHLLTLKAEVLYLADGTSEALEVLNEAEALAERFEQRFWCAELHRLRGVFLTLISADQAQIEACFCAAVRTATEQKSISLTKRAEATYTEYRRQKASGSGGRGFRLPL